MTGQGMRGARTSPGRAVPLDLIHTNNSPKPATARVSGRFDPPEIIVFDAIAGQLLKGLGQTFREPVARGGRYAKSTP